MSDTLEIGRGFSAANTTVTTTTETVAISTDFVAAPRQTVFALILALCQLTTGTATTTVTPRIRRGVAITDPLVGEANAVTIGAAAGSTEQFMAMVAEELADASQVRYSFTVQQASATGNGTILQAAILALLI